MAEFAAEQAPIAGFGNWAFVLFLILILLVFGFGLFFI